MHFDRNAAVHLLCDFVVVDATKSPSFECCGFATNTRQFAVHALHGISRTLMFCNDRRTVCNIRISVQE